ncbi:MAG: hypothetical protein ACREOW_12710 [Thermodesulfobacteriota bacterium]
MRMILTLLLIVMLFPFFALSGGSQIYGTIAFPGHPIEKNEVVIDCNGLKQNTYTDQGGYFRLFVPSTGTCTLMINYKGVWTDPLTVIIFDEPIRYNFSVRSNEQGGYILIRE